jgi:hypothetical protein
MTLLKFCIQCIVFFFCYSNGINSDKGDKSDLGSNANLKKQETNINKFAKLDITLLSKKINNLNSKGLLYICIVVIFIFYKI